MEITETLKARQSTHGNFEATASIAQSFSRILHSSPNWARLKDWQREGLELVLHKIARILSGDPNFIDSYRDCIGYTQLMINKLMESTEASDVVSVRQYFVDGQWVTEFDKIYRAYYSMLTRCYNPKTKYYKDYGGRGITVCDEWLDSKELFMEWAINNGHALSLSLDRIDPNGNYTPSNCRWTTREKQSNNQRRSRLVSYQDETKTVAEWAKKLGIKTNTLWQRLFIQNVPVEHALVKDYKYFKDFPKPKTWKHGSLTGYGNGCRCVECKACNSAYNKQYNKARRNK